MYANEDTTTIFLPAATIDTHQHSQYKMEFSPYQGQSRLLQKRTQKVNLEIKTIKAQGPRATMEDRCCVNSFGGDKILVGVFDGHGGDQVAQMCIEKACVKLVQLASGNPDMSENLRKLYKCLDEEAKELDTPQVGSTAAMVVVTKDRLWFSNCGDAMIAMKTRNGVIRFVSQDHKVENEKDRLQALGGVVTNWGGCARIYGTLNIARSIGDHYMKTFVISEPYVNATTCPKSEIEWIIVASDGLWDVFEPSQVDTSLRASNYNLNDLVNEAYKRGSTDNITIAFMAFTAV